MKTIYVVEEIHAYYSAKSAEWKWGNSGRFAVGFYPTLEEAKANHTILDQSKPVDSLLHLKSKYPLVKDENFACVYTVSKLETGMDMRMASEFYG
jgi:hypothetical protein